MQKVSFGHLIVIFQLFWNRLKNYKTNYKDMDLTVNIKKI
jgi:hypothetical protein